MTKLIELLKDLEYQQRTNKAMLVNITQTKYSDYTRIDFRISFDFYKSDDENLIPLFEVNEVIDILKKHNVNDGGYLRLEKNGYVITGDVLLENVE